MLISSVQLPTFENLTWLSIGGMTVGWGSLACIMCHAPNLQKLTIQQVMEDSDGEFEEFESVPNPPNSLKLQVKEIEFIVFEGQKGEMELIEYFLKNGKVLQQVRLHCLPFNDTKNILQKLIMLPSPSKSKIVFEPLLRHREIVEMKFNFYNAHSY